MWLLCASVLPAQIELFMPFLNGVQTGTNKLIPVRVVNFDSIVSIQLAVRWNPDVLRYSNIDQLNNLPFLSSNNFNVTNALDSGYIKFVWEGPNSFPGTSVADSTTLFRLRFAVIGPDTSSSPIKITEIKNSFPQLDFEIVKVIRPDSTLKAFELEECTLTHGFVAVGFTVATDEPGADDPFQLQVSPNPFSNNTHIAFFTEQTADVQIMILDAAGRLVFQKDMSQLPSGAHDLYIDQAIFSTKGAYYLNIRSGAQTAVRTMICK